MNCLFTGMDNPKQDEFQLVIIGFLWDAKNSRDCHILSIIAFMNSSHELVYAGRTQSGQGWRISPHSHDFHELVVVLQGTEEVFVNGGLLRAGPGHAVLFPAHCVHEEWSLAEGPLETLYLGFRSGGEGMQGEPLTCPDRKGRLRELVAWIFAERDASLPGAVNARTAYLTALVSEFVHLATEGGNDLVDEVRTFIRANLSSPLTLDDLARSAGLSRCYFIRAYRKLTGLTPMEDLRRIRAESARQLILTTRRPLKTVAPQVGISSEYHLSRLLKQELGVSARSLKGKG